MTDAIFEPHFDHTGRLDASLAELEQVRWRVENVLVLPEHQAWLRRDVSVARAAATTQIEGAGLDEAAVKELVKRGSTRVNLSEGEQANINAIRAYRFVDYLSDLEDQPIDELVIRQLNREFLESIGDETTPGEMPGTYRRGQNRVGDVYVPPDQGDVPQLMRALALWLRTPDDVHPVIRAGIAHLQLVAIHPFWDGNGRVARALATLVLQRSPFGFKKLLSIEKHLWLVRRDYFAAIERSLGARYVDGYDATPWLEFWAEAMVAHATALADELTSWRRSMDEAYARLAKLDLHRRQIDALIYAMRAGSLTRADYIEITKVSPMTASRDLRALVELGLLSAEGKTRDRVYRYVGEGVGG
ncbi:MAG: Fic family protein [Dehalococcoidia bacterium]|nr:MAG: Fic family protein [Dehalococcoidia bacterium]